MLARFVHPWSNDGWVESGEVGEVLSVIWGFEVPTSFNSPWAFADAWQVFSTGTCPSLGGFGMAGLHPRQRWVVWVIIYNTLQCQASATLATHPLQKIFNSQSIVLYSLDTLYLSENTPSWLIPTHPNHFQSSPDCSNTHKPSCHPTCLSQPGAQPPRTDVSHNVYSIQISWELISLAWILY